MCLALVFLLKIFVFLTSLFRRVPFSVLRGAFAGKLLEKDAEVIYVPISYH